MDAPFVLLFYPQEIEKKQGKRNKMTTAAIKEVGATVFLPALTHSLICTFTLSHDSSFMYGPVLLQTSAAWHSAKIGKLLLVGLPVVQGSTLHLHCALGVS